MSRLLISLFCVLASLTSTSTAAAHRPLDMGIHDPFADAGQAPRFDQIRDANARITRLTIYWARHVPSGDTKPADFDSADPASPGYNWTAIDQFVRSADERNMRVLITTLEAPRWAEGLNSADRRRRMGDPGTYRPNPKEFAAFNRAMAVRYSGKFPDPANPARNLPRVRHWQMWNEPNFGQYLSARRKTDIARHYVRMLNAGYDAVKRVSRSNLVLTAGLGPYGNNGHATDVEPQEFMRSILCLSGSGGRNLRDRRCTRRPKFDIWTQHPYTLDGTPRSKGGGDDAAAMGNMADIKRTLNFAVRAKNVVPARRKRLWVTEFGFFSDPPNHFAGDGRSLGKPLQLHASYLSESAYRLWRQGFSAFIWYGLGDQDQFPTGLYLGDPAANKAKPALDAFRFPFYADAARGRKVLVWGIAGRGGRATVRIERRSGSRWRRVADVRSDARGMIFRRISGPRGLYRATAVSGAQDGLVSEPYRAR